MIERLTPKDITDHLDKYKQLNDAITPLPDRSQTILALMYLIPNAVYDCGVRNFTKDEKLEAINSTVSFLNEYLAEFK